MIFNRIHIENLFSYYGSHEVFLPKPTEAKPITLISGRNGFGKTSFINSIKLLFLGTSSLMTDDVQIGRKLTQKTYLLGNDQYWQGIFNAQARKEDAKKFGVEITWTEKKGKVTAKRFWSYNFGEIVPHLEITTDFVEDGLGNNKKIDELEEAEEFLTRRLPKEITSFFFYDGEKIQAMAEAQQLGLIQNIEKLLGLAAVDTLQDQLRNAIRKWKSEGNSNKERANLIKLNSLMSQKEAEKIGTLADHNEFEAEIDVLERDIKKHERKLASFQTLAAQQDSHHLKMRMETARKNYENICERIGSDLPFAAPLWASLALVDEASTHLKAAAGDTSQRLAEEVKAIFLKLPAKLLDEPPHAFPQLTDTQKNLYRKKFENILKQYTETPIISYFSLKPPEIGALSERMAYYKEAKNERKRIADDLREASRLNRDWQQIRFELEEIEQLSPEYIKEISARKEALKKLENEKEALILKLGACKQKISSLETELKRLEYEIKAQESNNKRLEINAHHIARAEQAQNVFESYKTQLRIKYREDIELAVNKYVKKLLDSNNLIEKIELNENFELRYKDKKGNDIGLANISAGMKQLVAQGLLWALSEISGNNVPVVIGTPMARIDREHQENLLKIYFPQAAQQVILLPTNSEIDIEKYKILKPWINGEFRLLNPNGQNTTVECDVEMYSLGDA